MKIIGTTFEKLPRERLLIGFEGENQRATVRIDCASVFAEYPNATPALIVKPLFADAYPVVVDRNGTDVDWLITSEILSFSGDGEIQLVFYKDEVICKSAVSKIRVCRSLQVTGDMPDPVAQWVDDANAKLAEVDAQIVELEGMVDTATDAATRAEQSASTASAKAEQAAGSAVTATAKATEATNAAGTATAKAAEAALSATQARNSAVSAADSERGAMAKAEQAAGSALSASTDATLATEAAQTATEKAGDASASARAAQESETDAAASATAASESETAAKASETAASTSATQAAQSAQTANTAAQTATQKAAEATQSATGAATSATNAATSEGNAQQSAQAAASAQAAVEQTAEQLADSLEQIEQNTQDIAELDERKANIDGYYPDMTVGNAEQLNSSKYVENSEPYTLRTSGGSSDIGNREYLDAVVGGTVAWNQLQKSPSEGGTYQYQSAGSISYDGDVVINTATSATVIDIRDKQRITFQKYHIYVFSYDVKCSEAVSVKAYFKYALKSTIALTANTWVRHSMVTAYATDNESTFWDVVTASAVQTGSTLQIKNVVLIDLTQMFGTAVADYIYNLEQATAGAGVALFRSWFPKDYYEYNAGELLSVEGLQSHDMVGFNQWDEQWEVGGLQLTDGSNYQTSDRIRSKNYIPVLPNTTYYFHCGNAGGSGVAYYDSEKAFIRSNASCSNATFTTPNGCYYIRIANGSTSNPITTYNHDICINLAHNNSRNGEYEPYEKHSYPLDSSVILRGIPKVGANGVYWDGDRYLPDGTVERRYGIVDLGTLISSRTSTPADGRFFAKLKDSIQFSSSADVIPNIVCSRYKAISSKEWYTKAQIGISHSSSGYSSEYNIMVYDSAYTSEVDFKAAMSGVMLVYELATPTTETAQPYHSTQWVSDWGTEEFVSTGIVPVGHETRYPQNLRDKLQHLPGLAGFDGQYIISQSGSDMTLVPYAGELPALPSADGSYVLKCTVTNGVASYSWVEN